MNVLALVGDVISNDAVLSWEFSSLWAVRRQKELFGSGGRTRRVGSVRRFAAHGFRRLLEREGHRRAIADDAVGAGGTEDRVVVEGTDTENRSSVDATLTQLTKHAVRLVHWKHVVQRGLDLHNANRQTYLFTYLFI